MIESGVAVTRVAVQRQGRERVRLTVHAGCMATRTRCAERLFVPPPYMGPTLATSVILDSKLRKKMDLIHLDTSDHRALEKLGVIDLRNIYLALKFSFILMFLIVARKPDLVYIPVSYATLAYIKDSIFIIISKLFRRKIVCHLRGGTWLYSAGPLITWYVNKVHPLVDGQIVLGESLKRLFNGVLPEERIFVVPNGKNTPYDCKPRVGDKIRILFLANMLREKGVLDVLRAARHVCAECPTAEFVFAGGWNEADVREEVKLYFDENRTMPIRWLGSVHGKEKYDAINSSDIFVFPTYYPAEGHPWVIVEAMAAGLPIISTDQGAITESVIDGVNGFLVEKKNPNMIAEKLMMLVNDEELRQRMGRESRKIYEEKFTEDRMVEALSAVFRQVLAR